MTHSPFTKHAEQEFTYQVMTAISLQNHYKNLDMENEMNLINEIADDNVDAFLSTLHTVSVDTATNIVEMIATELNTARFDDELPTHTLAFALHRGSTFYTECQNAYPELMATLPVPNLDVLEAVSDVVTRMLSRTLDAHLMTVEDKELLTSRLARVGDRNPNAK